jgi:hypothetical protein
MLIPRVTHGLSQTPNVAIELEYGFCCGEVGEADHIEGTNEVTTKKPVKANDDGMHDEKQ